jgi:FkbM family methyltransferase
MTNLELEIAQRHLQAERWADAETIYRQVAQQSPEETEAWFWLGVIADRLDRLEESVACYQRVLALQPDSAETCGNLGTVLLKQGKLEAAITQHQRALQLMPDNPSAHYNLGVALYRGGQGETALAHYQQAIALKPDYASAHHNLAMVLYDQGKLAEAVLHYRRAAELMPENVNIHNSLGVTLYRQKRYEEAIAAYQQAIELQPDYVIAYDNLGITLKQIGRGEEAIAQYRRAIELNPNFANAYNNLGNVLREQGRLEAALANCEAAIRLKPRFAEAHNSYGCVLVELGRFTEAIATYEQAICYKPHYPDAHLNLGLILLLLGDLRRGFSEYHWRWRTDQCSTLRYPTALWDGSDLPDKTILLTAEQGFGDTIQFARYATLVAQRVGTVVIACQKPLIRLLSTVPGVARCVDRDRDDVETHVHAPLLELPYILGTTLETIPAVIPYLGLVDRGLGERGDRGLGGKAEGTGQKAEDAEQEDGEMGRWRDGEAQFSSLIPQPPSLKIGIVWSTSPTSATAAKRSCSLPHFFSLLDIPEITLYSLQVNPAASDLALLQKQERVENLGDQLQDFADTAAAIARLDLVISVDTAVAHLAGALGKPVWTLLPWVADWRWLRDRDDTPWYPTMRLFRQTHLGDWTEVFEQIKQALEEWGSGRVGEWGRDVPPRLPILPSSRPPVSPSPPHSLTADALLPPAGFNRLRQCRHGSLLYNINDLYIGRSLELYGEWSEGEIALFQHLVRSGDVVVEVGANIGTHTVFFAKAVGVAGMVLAFEPQRIVFQTLCGNLALNSLTNVHCYSVGLGEAPGFAQIPVLDYRQPLNFGGVSLGQVATGEQVQIATLDSFALPRCRLLKIDVEGMELAVLKGAVETIRRCQPILYLENDRQDRSIALIHYIQSLGYNLFWHRPTLFNPNNFYQNPHNVFGNTLSVNMLGLHPSHGIVINGMEPVTEVT